MYILLVENKWTQCPGDHVGVHSGTTVRADRGDAILQHGAVGYL